MIKNFYILLLSLGLSLPVAADDVSLGYCDGGNVESAVSGYTKVAAFFPTADFPMYAGSTIVGVRIGLNSDVVSGVNVFLRSSLDGSDLYSGKSQTLYQGWNDIYFSKPVTYPTGDLYVGYDVATSVRPGTSGTATANSCYGYSNGTWTDLAAAGQQPLCIELLISGDSYSHTDVGLVSVSPATVAAGSEFSFSGVLRNNTNQVLSSVSMSYDFGEGPQTAEATVNDVLPGETGSFTLPATAPGVGNYTARLVVRAVGDNADEYAFNDTATCDLSVLNELIARKVLLEEFTGQNCVNCPSGHARLDQALAHEDNVITVAHHWGFGTDDMTAPGSTEYTWFYNSGSNTFAPGMMLDRHYYDESYSLQGTSGAAPGPVFVVPESEYITSLIDEEKAKPASVAITLKRNYDPATRLITIQVGMKQIEGRSLGDNPVLTIDLLENGIHAYQSGSTDANYQHDKVNRRFVTDPLGDPLTLSTGDYNYATYTSTLDAGWNPDNMEIVAFVSNYDKYNCNNCDVYNAADVSLVGNDDIPTSVGQSASGRKATAVAVYNAAGMRIPALQTGLNIVKFSNGTTRKVYKAK